MEGPQAVREALARPASLPGGLLRLFATERAAAQQAGLVVTARRRGVEVLHVDDRVLADLAGTVTPQGLVGVADLPAPALDEVLDAAALEGGPAFVVVLDRIADPGNAGTAIRTADAAGADAVVLTAGSVDPRNPKAVRASVGSLFHLPVVTGATFAQVAAACAERGVRLLAADARGARTHAETDLAASCAVVFGNEAHGLGDDVRRTCDDVVRVPLSQRPRPGYAGAAESLNLAATVAVVAFEAARQRAAAPVATSVPEAPAREEDGSE